MPTPPPASTPMTKSPTAGSAGSSALAADPATGLTEAEAARRLAAEGPNEVAARQPVRLPSRILAQLRDPLIMVLLGAVVLTLAIGDHPDAIVIALVVVVNTTVGVVQEIRADNAVAALSALSAPHAQVRRDGAVRDLPAAEVVPGDVLLLAEGDIVAADAALAEASALLLDESMLTGESVAVDKTTGDTLSAGTVVVRGRGVATVTATGAASALGRIAALLDDRRDPTPLQRRLAALGRVLAVVTLALCVLVFALGLIRGLPLGTMAVTAISLAVAAVPESLPAVVTLALALGARRMVARHALVRRLPAVETLGSVSVLATDKTGTLTEGRMVVQHVWTPRGSLELEFTGVGYEPEGDALVDGRAAEPDELRPVRELLTAAALCNDATLHPPDGEGPDARWTVLGDPMEGALLTAAAKAGCPDRAELAASRPRIAEAPFDSLRRRMTTLHRYLDRAPDRSPAPDADQHPGWHPGPAPDRHPDGHRDPDSGRYHDPAPGRHPGQHPGLDLGRHPDGHLDPAPGRQRDPNPDRSSGRDADWHPGQDPDRHHDGHLDPAPGWQRDPNPDRSSGRDAARHPDPGPGPGPGGPVLVCLKGAPDAVLDPAFLTDGPGTLDLARERAARLAERGYRVLAVASGVRDGVPDPVTAAESGLALLGLVALSDPPKPHAAATLAACRSAGITPVLITGDHPATARAIATRVSLLGEGDGELEGDGGEAGEPDGRVVTGADVAAGRVADLTSVRVFARTDPQQKLDVVEAWRDAGAVTAMTGDGVNDGPALHRADIGVAMGARGTEVARQAADLVLTDDELSTVVAAVEEGRRVYDNIRRFLVYGMAGGAAEILVMLAGPLLGLPLPLRAGQILWINLLTHGLTGVAMGAEPASPGTMRRPPRPPDQHILGGGAWQRLLLLAGVVTAATLAAGLAAKALDLPWQSVLFLALLAAQLGVVLGLRARLFTPRNPFLPLSVLASALLGAAALYVPFLRSVLETEPLGWTGVGLAAACAPVGFLAARLVRTAFRTGSRTASRTAPRAGDRNGTPGGTPQPSGLR
ncbi:HAD-IC family P-type ATPase [Streptomyces sp. NPDC048623]|uniref:cation-translocating P-type ATPase n=1 Tax=Streptomyces sp. NPDC048623 TaxID=3155761 RepID=UPI00343FDEB8